VTCNAGRNTRLCYLACCGLGSTIGLVELGAYLLEMESAQPLNPESKALLDAIAKLNVKLYHELESVEEARARMVGASKAAAGDIQYDGSRKELFIPQPDYTGRH